MSRPDPQEGTTLHGSWIGYLYPGTALKPVPFNTGLKWGTTIDLLTVLALTR